MSAESRYQSQLFNLILQRSQALTEQWQRNLRQAKVTTLWGMQLGLYPLYLLFQVSRLSQHLLREGDLQGQRLLRAVADPSQDHLFVAADDPIRKVLATIQIQVLDPNSETGQLESEQAQPEQPQFWIQVQGLSSQRPSMGVRYQKWLQQWAEQNPLHCRATRWLGLASEPVLQIRGIATDLQDRQLHLVTPANESLDVLTPIQQGQLQQLIAWQMAHYRRQQRLNQSLVAMTRLGWADLPVPRTRSQMLPPIRAWRRAMAWMQAGPMAAQINLFQEAKQQPLSLANQMEEEALFLSRPSGWEATLSQWTPRLTPEAMEMIDEAIATWETASWQVIGPTATEFSDYISQQLRQTQFQSGLSLGSLDPHQFAQPHLEPRPLRQRATWVPQTLRSAFSALLGWPAPVHNSVSQPSVSDSLAAASLRPHPSPSRLTWQELYGADQSSATPFSASEATATSDTPAQPSSTPPSAAGKTFAQRINPENGNLEIEVEAVTIEYEKHLLERILIGLDWITLRLEKYLGWLWQKLWSPLRSYVQQVLSR